MAEIRGFYKNVFGDDLYTDITALLRRDGLTAFASAAGTAVPATQFSGVKPLAFCPCCASVKTHTPFVAVILR